LCLKLCHVPDSGERRRSFKDIIQNADRRDAPSSGFEARRDKRQALDHHEQFSA
jgi:hypothetical protein